MRTGYALRPVSLYNTVHTDSFTATIIIEVLIFVEGGKPENPEKNPRSRDENQQQTQPTYDAGSGNRTRATAVGGECSHHSALSLLPIFLFCLRFMINVTLKSVWITYTFHSL